MTARPETAGGEPAQLDASIVAALDARTRSHQMLSAWTQPCDPPSGFEGLSCSRFEITSRGDRVPGHLIRSASADTPQPLILLQHGAGGDRHSPYLVAARRWVEGGAAVASIDFPLHGERRSPELSERLLPGIAQGVRSTANADDGARRLWQGFIDQSVSDLRATLDHLLALPEIKSDQCAYASFSLGSIVGAFFLAVDARPKAAALALGGGGFGPAELDPARYVGAIAPRPLLMVNAALDEVVPPEAGRALFEAAGEPKKIEWFETGHDQLPGVALKAMWSHMRDAIGIRGATRT